MDIIRPEHAADQPRRIQQNIPGATSISILRRVHDSRYATRYFVGDGLDVGGGIDSIALFAEMFPAMRHVFVFDRQHGDAQYLERVPDASFDFVYSSHCLEHVVDPSVAIRHWIRVVKPGGYLVIQVPDEDLYEQGHWPSRFNSDHKHTFTMFKMRSWSPVSINVLDFVRAISDAVTPLSIFRVDIGVRPSLLDGSFDQTRTPSAECAIEFILQKHPA
ncbi:MULTISPECIES: class I SAM-dependent methyltransferase [Cupriavidus]|uniref:Class I SAM-dependent methyltransferase n=1 Tax=Cupriavidus pauculus TaxID=82633 RepID=A0A3G8H134_9BURK|nr:MULTISPECIES: class I SAM-dependent methyltransferase [Cupriavidus]AZG14084.1 class I SAM-dependent methyltransferase [Cupriavidus pauculus]MDT6959884.1 class I SAM-dependent methyltransferase [Cupriavidus sp. SZY C1]